MSLSRIGAAATPSATQTLNARAKALARQGADVVVLTAGEADFDTPVKIRDAAHQAIRDGITRYTAHPGTPELRAAVAAKFWAENGLHYSTEQILVSNGGKQALCQVMLCLVEGGDEVLLPAPYWVSYADQASICGADIKLIDTTRAADMKLTAAMLEAAVTERSKLLVLNSPCNPTGVVLTGDELRAIVRVALAHDLWIISDEVYEKIIFDGLAHVSPGSFGEEALRRVITVNGVSKTYAMTGWRIGYAGGPAEVIGAASSLQSNFTSAACSVSQMAALEALTGPQDAVEEMRRAFDRRRKLMVDGLNRIPGVRCLMPQGTFYAFPDCRGLLGKRYGGRLVETSAQLAEALLEQVQLAVVPGTVFGAEGHLRLCFGKSEESIEKGLARLRQFAESAAG